MKYSRLLAGAACVFVCVVLGCPSSQVTPPPAPVLTGPAYDQLFPLPEGIQLLWQAVEGCTAYAVQVGADAEFAGLVDDGETSQPSWAIPGDTLAAGTYWWRVRGRNGSGWGPYTEPSRFTIEQGAPLPPTLIAPEADAFVLDVSPVFSWEASAGATEYVFEMVQGEDFEQKDSKYSDSTTSTSVTVAEMPFDGLRRSWRVKACVPEEMCSEFSEARPFMRPSTPEGVPAPPQPLSPADGAVIYGGAVDLTWAVPGDADWFQSQLAPNPGFAGATDGEVVFDTSEDVSHQAWSGLPQTNAQYYWRVRAGSLAGWGMWSSPWSFTSAPPAKPDLAAGNVTITPATPVAADPITLHATVSNVGDAPSPACAWVLKLDGAAIGHGTVPALAPGAATGEITVNAGALAVGQHSVEFIVDEANAVAESNEANNRRGPIAFAVAAPPRPDLVAGAIVVEPAALQEPAEATLRASVTNAGNAPAGAFVWRMTLDGSVAGEGTVDGLAAGATFNAIAVETAPLGQGQHQVTFTVDPANAIAESNESNNSSGPVTFTVAVSPASGVAVLAPNGGEAWQAGETASIRWGFEAAVNGLVRISLLYGSGALDSVLAESQTAVPGENTLLWPIPEDQALRPDYYVQIECITTAGLSDRSDGVFAVASDAPQVGQIQSVLLPGGVPLEMVWVPAGTFMMGAAENEQDRFYFDMSKHEVTLTRGFWMGRFEVTKAQWMALMGTQPWSGKDDVLDEPDSPAVYLSWHDTQAFIAALSAYTGEPWMLPTEAEWEYACRAGTQTRYYWGDDPGYAQATIYTWFKGNCDYLDEQYAHVVGLKTPNAWGLHDMSGNAWEWCHDWFTEDTPDAAAVDPLGPEYAYGHVTRGGCFGAEAAYLRSALHVGLAPVTLGALVPSSWAEGVFSSSGFRVIRPTDAGFGGDLLAVSARPRYSYDESDEATLVGEITNRGRVPVSAFDWELTLDGAVVASGTKDGLPGGGGFSVEANVGRLAFGQHEVTLVVDTANQVAEPDETNNTFGPAAFEITMGPRADLQPLTPSFSPSYPNSEDILTVSTLVKNTGLVRAEAVSWRFLVDGAPLGSGTIASIGHYSQTTVRSTIGPLPVGTHTIMLTVDPDDAILEKDETNNTSSFREVVVTVPLPDLRAIALAVAPIPCTTLDSPIFTARIRNIGPRPAESFSTTLYVDEAPVYTAEALSLGASGAYMTIDLPAGPLVAGRHTARFVVDPDNTILESNETNNTSETDEVVVAVPLPDLEADTLSMTPVPCTTLDSPVFTAQIRNGGRRPAESFSTTLYVDEAPVYTADALSLGALGASMTVDLPAGPLVAGRHTARFAVDPANTLGETNVANNASATIEFDVIGLPDLIADAVSVSPSSCRDTDPLTFSAQVRNAGLGAAVSFTATFYVDGAPVHTTEPLSLAGGGGNATVSCEITPLAAGMHTVRLVVDPGNQCREPNEDNNTSPLTGFEVTVALPDLVADAVSVSPDPCTTLDTLTVSAQIRNADAGPVSLFAATFYVDDVPVLTRNGISFEGADGPVTVTARINPLPRGPHTIKLIVDPANTVAESNEGNNASPVNEIEITHMAPDLVVNTVSITRTPSGPLQNWAFSAEVRNDGIGATGPFDAVFYVDGAPACAIHSPSIAPGATATVTGSSGPLPAGSHTLTFAVDPDDAIEELDETNNQSSPVSFTAAGNLPQAGDVQSILLPGGVPLEMVWIPAGTFMMGSPTNEQDRIYGYDLPQHEVTLPHGFWMGRFEVTKAQWTALMGTQPWTGKDNVLNNPNSPAVFISWADTQAFMAALGAYTGDTWLLPIEEEWEYACRAGTQTRFYWGDDPDYSQTGAHAWFEDNCDLADEHYAHVVGLKTPNAWGLHDMSGNAAEWCQEWDIDMEALSPGLIPYIPGHTLRGACCEWPAPLLRSASRMCAYTHIDTPENLDAGEACIGFRLVKPTDSNLHFDLAVTSVKRGYFTEIRDVTLEAEVTNLGRGPAPEFGWEILLDGAEVGTGTGPALTGRGRTTLTAEVGRLSAGEHEVTVILDRSHRLPDADRTNNTDGPTAFEVHMGPRADLRPFAPTVTPAFPSAEDPLAVSAIVQNAGSLGADAVQWRLLVDGASLRSGTIASIGQYSQTTVESTIGALPAGTHTIAVMVDPDNAILELDDTNNTSPAVQVVVTAALPDLQADPVVVTPIPCTTLDTLAFTAQIKNNGSRPAQSFVAIFHVDGQPVYTTDVLSLDGRGAATTVSGQSGPLAEGNHTVTLLVDSAEAVEELDETNNESETVSLTVVTPRPDLTVASLTANAADGFDDPHARVIASVANVGKVACPPFTWRLFLNNVQLAEGSAEGIPAETTGEAITAQVDCLTFGTSIMRFVVDPDSVIEEMNEANNEREIEAFAK